MCGIAGMSGEHPEIIRRMTEALYHRGPDGNAIFVGKGASLGHARLAILDPRPEGNQPMWNADESLAIVYNGEIFNFKELREQERMTCKTNTDTEVLLRLFERYGMAFLPRLRGMFAFGIYDSKTRTWHLARDPSGIKPLFVSRGSGNFAFASEMRSLLCALPSKPALSHRSLSLYLRLQYVPGPQTMCEGIEQVPPGTVLTWHDGKAMTEQFTAQTEPMPAPSKEAFKDMLPGLLDAAVAEHLVSDRPVGVFLSGGMDSSIMLHHMTKHAAKPVCTFTVRFDATEAEGAKRFNTDADLAAMTAAHYGTEHRELVLTADMYREAYRQTARSLDQPNADAVSVAQFLLARLAKEHVDVVLTGAGGDELFGGYPRYRIARILRQLRLLPPSLRGMLARLGGYPSDVLQLSPGPKLAERLLARPEKELTEIVRGEWFSASATSDLFAERFSRLQTADPIREFMEFDRRLWLVDESLRLTDATTMGSGVEGRVPFLDPRIIAASLATPSAWHVTARRTKSLLKDAYRHILPGHLFTLPKSSFYPPLAKWLRRETSPLAESMLEHTRIREFFDVDTLRTLFVAHRDRKAYHLHTLSSVIQLSHWFEEVYDA